MKKYRHLISYAYFLIAIVLIGVSLIQPRAKGDTDKVAAKIERNLSGRLDKLDRYGKKALERDINEWIETSRLPEDMVVYRYVGDKMQSWANQFPLSNDDIVLRPYPRQAPRRARRAPLAEVGADYSFINFGNQNCYLAKKMSEGMITVVVGLRLPDSRQAHVDEGYVYRSLSSPDGSIVKVGGKPSFKIVYDTLPQRNDVPSILIWIAFLLVAIGAVIHLRLSPKFQNSLLLSLLLVICSVVLFSRYPITSGELSQIMVILVINFVTFLITLSLFICRKDIWKKIKSKAAQIALTVLICLLIIAIYGFCYIEIFKVSVYTHICVDLSKIGLLTFRSGIVFFSLILLLVSTVLLDQLLQPVRSRYLGKRVDFLTIPGRVITAIVLSSYLIIVSHSLNFNREKIIVSSWAENLSSDRDNALESELRLVERQIADDEFLAKASDSDENSDLARRRLIDMYFLRTKAFKDYNLDVQIGGNSEALAVGAGVPIAQNSRFYYSPLIGQRCRYVGVFQYYVPDSGTNTLYITIEAANEPKTRSIYAMLGLASPNETSIPSRFSYAKYQGCERLYIKGTYAYPTQLNDEMLEYLHEIDGGCHVKNGYIHFINVVSDNEVIVISRRDPGLQTLVIAFLFVAIFIFLFTGLFTTRRVYVPDFEKMSLKRALIMIIVVSLVLTMSLLSIFSIRFVFNSNESNARTMMADRTISIQSMLQAGVRNATSVDELGSRETLELLRKVADNTNCDISLYRPDGRVFLSTSPELFEKNVLGHRLNEVAFKHIIHDNEGRCIQREKYGQRRIYTMYAPLQGADGSVIAIFASPYMEPNYEFELDAVVHTVGILVVFLVLLFISIVLLSTVIDRTFKPLSVMSRKMKSGGLGNFEHIDYGRQDEISSIVQSYNRMVTDLSASTKALAQAERDKAWSEMARNVAHEIKNPLTPMQLQIQRIQRLKANGDPSWQTKFDDMAKVLLDHIVVLTETANQFSDFAKLYSEEPVDIDLDAMLQEEVQMYDNRPGYHFEYLGFPGVHVSAPRPQLVRVFVNLLNNAVQACEGMEDARIRVSLRKAGEDGYFEIVFEDNGPGVDESNIEKLFTPKFTTKSSGSGLGLSICRSILERCGATISYTRSFTLGGAEFVIRYPEG